jgi:sodium-dependent phosphate transporter
LQWAFVQLIAAMASTIVILDRGTSATGANDVANAIGPLSSIFYIWENGVAPGSKSPVPTWILAYGGFGIQCGLILYGYNIMRSLGNNLTHMSPIRGTVYKQHKLQR